MNTNAKARSWGETLRHGLAAFLVLVAGAMYLLGSTNAGAAPLAGTVIGNQATATYVDAGSTARQATSNQVQTTVSQVKSFTLTANGARTAAPGQTVYYPHIITNTGNGNDVYTLGALASTNFAGPNLPHSNLQYFGDNAGSPDTVAITGTPSVGAGQQFRFWVAGTVPASAVSGNTADITFNAADTGGNTAPALTDRTTVAASVITVNKTMSVTQGASPSAVFTVTLAYTNSGTVAATNVTINDVMPGAPAGALMTYVGNATWSGSVTPLTDAVGGDPAGITYEFNNVSKTVTAVIASVPGGFSGNVTFQVQVPTGLTPQFITNTATYTTTTQTTPASTSATFEVVRTVGVVANGSTTAIAPFTGSAVNGTAEPVTIASAAAGATLFYTNVIWNTGNAADTFVITTDSPGTFPVGTTTSLLQSDGITSLVANTTPSVPVVVAGACPAGYVLDAALQRCGYRVVLRVQLPANAPATAVAANITVTAASSFSSTTTDTVIDRLSAVTSNFIDLTSNTARTDSTPAGSAAAGNATTQPGATGFGTTGTTVITTNPVTPSTTGTVNTTFLVYVNNGGTINDTYNLTSASVPAGWTVTYRADGGVGNCSTTGAILTQTTVNAGANRLVCAIVTVPATTSGNAAPGTYPVDFIATSATNPAVTDTLRDAVTVATVRSVTLTPNNTQQTFPGGSVTYTHILTNLGNVAETMSFPAGFLTNSRAGWTAAAFQDDGDGVFTGGVDDAAAQAINTAPAIVLQPGAVNSTRVLYVRVFSPPGATAVDPANVTTLTATYNTTSTAVATDTTSVTDGLLLTKSQRTINCDGTPTVPPGTLSAAPIPAGPLTAPGRCLQYQIVGQNTTAASLNSVIINDNIPGSTTLNIAGAAACASVSTTAGTVTAPANGATGTISVNVGTMVTGSSVTIAFCVRIDP